MTLATSLHPPPASDAERDPNASEVASVLLVDDHPNNLMSIAAILEPLGHRIVTARSGEEALRHVLACEFAVILLDVQMPGMDGLQTARVIRERERSRHVPILFLTAISRDASQILKGYHHGAVDYLLKPFESEILCAKVSVFVELFRRGARLQRQQEMLRLQERLALERRNDLRFRQVTDALPACVWSVHPDGRIRYCNRHYDEFAGGALTPGTSLNDLPACHPDDLEALRAWFAATSRGEESEVECRLHRARDHADRYHFFRAVAEMEDDGSIASWVVTATDIDDRKRYDVQREQLLVHEQNARAEAEAANRAKDVFLATVSHELRTPLSAILGWTQMLQRGLVDPSAVSSALDTIERNTRAQMHLTEDILDASRAAMGKLHLERRCVDLVGVVANAVESLRPVARSKGIEINLPDATRHVEVFVDADRMRQVVWNLLSNAIKFTRRGGSVRIEVETGDRAEMRVVDTGQGISPAFLPFVFDRFRQADPTNTRVHGGLGLGLAIVRTIVELHGGTVTAASDGPDCGATFTVRLPFGPTDASPSDDEQRPHLGSS